MDWEGNSVTGRLGIGWDDDREQWAVSGRYEYEAGTGSAAEMVQLARMILENIPDQNGPPLAWKVEREDLPFGARDNAARVINIARDPAGWGMSREQAVRMGGLMIAAGLHLIREGRPAGGYAAAPAHLPFALRLDEE